METTKPKRPQNWLENLRSKQQAAAKPGSAAAGAHAVLYVFHEGYTNAVRRPVRFADLL